MSKKSQKGYTDEFKKRAVKLTVESDQSTTMTAKNLGVSTSSLCKWVKESSLSPDKKAAKKDSHDLYEELKKLKKENSRLREEREILKKAAAYFASESK